jgi:chemotaxis protein CheZ
MEYSAGDKDELLERAKTLVAELESGNVDSAKGMIDGLAGMRESELFQEVGKLTRDLHDTIKNFQIDSRITNLTETEIPDAKERLNHVITLTQEAADKTLGIVEETLPKTEQLEQRAAELKAQWDRFRSRDMKVEEFRGLSQEIDEFLAWTADNATDIHGGLSEVMMAQSFQDLTGQIIRRVINLVQDVEENLVDLIKITGTKMVESKKVEPDDKIAAEGPAVPGVKTKNETVGNQDEVDDLLSSLGF